MQNSVSSIAGVTTSRSLAPAITASPRPIDTWAPSWTCCWMTSSVWPSAGRRTMLIRSMTGSLISSDMGFPFLLECGGLDALIDLLAVHLHGLRRSDSQAHLLAADAEHGDADVVVDADGFVCLSRKDQHGQTPFSGKPIPGRVFWLSQING